MKKNVKKVIKLKIIDGTNAEIFLEMLNDRDIVVVVTFDDASKEFVFHSYIYYELFSSL